MKYCLTNLGRTVTRLWAGRPGFDSPQGQRFQTGSWAHPVSYWMDRRGSEADYSPPSSAEIKKCVDLFLHSPTRLHGAVLKHSADFNCNLI